jgi:putative peptide zinc metalloprotease protein
MTGIRAESTIGTVRLRAGVQRIELANGRRVLFATGRTPLRVTPTADEIWPMLVEGTQFEELVTRLQELHPQARSSRERVIAFVEQLGKAGLLEGTEPAKAAIEKKEPIRICDLDPLARMVAGGLRRLPPALRATLVLAVAGMAAMGAARYLLSAPTPRFLDAFQHFSFVGLALVMVVAAPLHEIGHAIACRMAGVAAGPLCVRRGWFGWLRPFVETPEAFLAPGRWGKFGIAAGGLFFDLLLCGAAAWTALLAGRTGLVGGAATFVFLYCVMNLNVGTSPLQPGDGSNMLGALLDDDFARQAALFGEHSRFANARNVRIYRLAGVAHLLLTGVLLWFMR